MSLAEADRTAEPTDDAVAESSAVDGLAVSPDAGGDDKVAAPIYAELVADLGDPTEPPA